MASIADKFAEEYVAHAVDISRLSESLRERIVLLLEDMQDDIAKRIEDSRLDERPQTPTQVRRQEALIKQSQDTIGSAYGKVERVERDQLLEIADWDARRAPKIIGRVFNSPKIASVAWTKTDLKVLVSKALINGAPSRDWWDDQSKRTQLKFAQQIRLGVLQGESIQEMVRRIRGKATGRSFTVEIDGKPVRRREFTGGVMQTTTREATALVRTSVQTISNQVQKKTFEANDDLLKGYQWLSTLDTRTTPICIARSGGAWDFEGNPLPSSRINIKFPGPPPAHWQCRSILIPVAKSWNELSGGEFDLPEFDAGTQASMDGQVAADLNYSDWLKKQPAEVQRDVLGAGRYRLWKAGDISLTDLVDSSGRALTVKQLDERYG